MTILTTILRRIIFCLAHIYYGLYTSTNSKSFYRLHTCDTEKVYKRRENVNRNTMWVWNSKLYLRYHNFWDRLEPGTPSSTHPSHKFDIKHRILINMKSDAFGQLLINQERELNQYDIYRISKNIIWKCNEKQYIIKYNK